RAQAPRSRGLLLSSARHDRVRPLRAAHRAARADSLRSPLPGSPPGARRPGGALPAISPVVRASRQDDAHAAGRGFGLHRRNIAGFCRVEVGRWAMGLSPRAGLFGGVALLSAAAVLLQIVLTRLFSALFGH